MKLIKRLIKDERGLESSEYALLLALIALAIVGAVGLLKDQIAASFNAAAVKITPP